MTGLRRRDVIGLAAAALVAPLPLRAQNKIRVIGFLSSRTRDQAENLVASIREGLSDEGFTEGTNIAIEHRYADSHAERLPALAAELVAKSVDVIVAGGTAAPAIAATRTIPVVFTTGFDPVAIGYVKNLNRPEGNVTGATFYSGALGAKQIEILRELAPRTEAFGLLIKPESVGAPSQVRDTQKAARAIGMDVFTVSAATENDIAGAFAGIAGKSNAALMISVDPFFDSHSKQLVELAGHHKLPTAYYIRDFVRDGGLVSYGASITEAYHQAGVYAGRLLKGAKPADLPIQIPTRFELAINLKTASALKLNVSPTLLATADEVIE